MPYPALMPWVTNSAADVTHPFRTPGPWACASGGMTKPTRRKRSESEVVSEVMLRRAGLAYAAVANLDPSDLRWRHCWRALSVAAIGMVAAIQEAAEPSQAPASGRSAGGRASSTSSTTHASWC